MSFISPHNSSNKTSPFHLLLIYALHTHDYEWVYAFYPVQRFIQEGLRCGVKVSVLLEHDALERGHQGLMSFVSNEAPKIQTKILIRGRAREALYQMLKTVPFPYVNSYESCRVAHDKRRMYAFFEHIDTPFPALFSSEIVCSPSCTAFPLIAKPVFGQQGRDIHLLHTYHDARSLPQTEEYLFQAFIDFDIACDIRVFFCAGDILAVVERRAHGGLVSNVHASCNAHITTIEISAEQKKEALRIAQKSGLWYGTVDFLRSSRDTLTVCEINASAGFEGLEIQTGTNIAGSIIERLAYVC